jgi:hypothetical protein
MRMTERGIALVEVVVAATLTGWFSLLASGTVLRAGAELNRRAERFAAEQALRAANGSLRLLLESNAPAGGDLLASSSSGLSTRVVRGVGVLCEADSGALVVRRSADLWQAVRSPVAGRDSLLIGQVTEPGWVAVELLANPVSRACPDGTPGTALPAAVTPSDLLTIGPGRPLRVFEPVELRSYLSAGSGWIGVRSIATGEVVQPLAGPLPGGGLWLGWLDRTGAPVSAPQGVSAVQFRVTALTARSMPDSIAGFIALKGESR